MKSQGALRGIRGTSAAYAAAYAALFLSVVLGPYRRGETWAWWALLGSLLLQCVLVVLRVPLVGAHLGVSPALNQCGIGVVALLLDVSRVRSARNEPSPTSAWRKPSRWRASDLTRASRTR